MKDVVPKYEGKACDAVVRVLELHEQATRRSIRSAEKEDRGEGIELVCEIGFKTLAIEHTRLESYRAQTSDSAQFVRAFEPLESKLAGKLPTTGQFWLIVPPHALRKVRKHELQAVVERVEEWLPTSSPRARCRAAHCRDVAESSI